MSTNETEYINHEAAKRVNNPTMEQRGFMAHEEEAPYDRLYPRDPSKDPQLVWKGKDEQDRQDLAVPTVPIYIQEKIMPSALIDDLRKQWAKAAAEPADKDQPDLFSDTFNGLQVEDGQDKFEAETEFFQHPKNWANRMILGDSLLVMNSLAEKEGLKGKVQCIYIDPPYGIKFGSNWQVSTRKRDVKDGKAEDAAREPEVVRAFRDTWKLGIHSYLAYLRDRLVVARELLTETGSVFVQIGDENVHLVRCLMDEVFGAENFVAEIPFNKTSGAGSPAIGTLTLASVCDFVIWYATDKQKVKYRQLYAAKDESFDPGGKYSYVEEPSGNRRRAVDSDKGAIVRFYRLDNFTSQASPAVPFVFKGKTYVGGWKTNDAGLANLAIANRIAPSSNSLNYVRFIDDFPAVPINNTWMDVGGIQSRIDPKVYVVQTATKVVQRCILMSTDPGDLVLDPTCGSGTTAYVAEQWGRRWITTDTSRVSLALARTRLMSAKYPSYLLADSPEGIKKETELTGKVPPPYETKRDIRQGFVYKRVPHVTLKSIANNPDIREGMTREEIDKAIAKHADTEYLVDQPYEDGKRVRVAGPFTVESLSPHRILAMEDDLPASQTEAKRDDAANDFVTMVLDNLLKAGVQNTKKGERLKFDDLAPHAGKWIHAKGTYTAADGSMRRVAVSVGPEYGAVSPAQIKEAAKEATLGLGHDVLVVCGYAFDPHVSEEAKHYGALTVLPARMNADLLMADDLLKKTGAGNLFMVFGEPDIEVSHLMMDGPPGGYNGDYVQVRLNGLDVFDPTTGEIRSNSVDDIACWFIDTNYNGESFFVRHAYFTGGNEPYEKLKKALKAEIDEAAWSELYSNESRPFRYPETGKFAVKVINHYGDEVLKVYEVTAPA